ncbi:MAG: ribosome-associated translation inhibitor RaiA [Candidatus Kerfeldbacteria bacterium]|nr:ribosome-associated translation inhibitor RaiA [Candidatus Kerfeldbacteria bacterium]
MPTIISGKNFKLSPTLQDYVTQELRKLEKFSSQIISSKAELDHDHNQHTGKVYRVELSVRLPGIVLMAGQKAEHMRTAIEQCLKKLERQVTKYKDKQTDRSRRSAKKFA